MLVRELMTTEVVAVPLGAFLDEAVDLMLQHDVGSVLVMDESTPVGIVTETDVLAIGSEREAPFGDIAVGDAMSEELITGQPNTTVSRAIETMNEHGIKRLPIVEEFRVVGIVTISDVVREHVALISEAYGRSDRRLDWTAEDD
ncbi:MAG: CBS domain-containing protein [Halodesulfurarchaeum sp.]